MRVADIVTPDIKDSRSEWQIAFNAIASKHFDYVLCDKQDLSILCVIELDDQSHTYPRRKKRDQLLTNICQSANLPLLNFPAKHAYIIDEIKQKISPYIPNTPQSAIESKIELKINSNQGLTK